MLENIIKFAAITLDVDSHERQYQPNQETLKTEGMIQLPFEWPDEAISVNTIKERIKDIQEKIKGHSSELYKLVALLDNYKLNTQIRIICNASRETVNSYNQRCKDISNLLQQFNQLQQNSASIGIIADRFIFYAKSNKDAEQLTAISAYMSAFNNDLKTIKSNLIKVVEPSFLAKLSYALDTKNEPLKYAAWIGGLCAFILGMAIAITFAVLGTYLVAPLVVALVGLISFTIGGLSTSIESSYLGELVFNNAEDNPHYKSLITAIQEQEVHCSKIKEMNNIFKKQNEPEKMLSEEEQQVEKEKFLSKSNDLLAISTNGGLDIHSESFTHPIFNEEKDNVKNNRAGDLFIDPSVEDQVLELGLGLNGKNALGQAEKMRRIHQNTVGRVIEEGRVRSNSL